MEDLIYQARETTSKFGKTWACWRHFKETTEYAKLLRNQTLNSGRCPASRYQKEPRGLGLVPGPLRLHIPALNMLATSEHFSTEPTHTEHLQYIHPLFFFFFFLFFPFPLSLFTHSSPLQYRENYRYLDRPKTVAWSPGLSSSHLQKRREGRKKKGGPGEVL